MPTKQGCRGKGISTPTPIPFPQDFCGDPHMDPYGDIHMGIPTEENHIPILNTIPWVWGSILAYPYGYSY